ncbi:MAG TPA: ATP-binding cassette domain-containing protein [Kofleriaceae bacterium]|nr:ATP-binding cassette domain-containing protein [Kofleriaceae bacterium]
MATILTVSDLHKRLARRELLRGVSFAVGDRDRIGMIGANGAGKSTLLKMLVRGAGVDQDDPTALEPDSGLITWKRGLVLEYVAQEPRFAAGATVRSTLVRDGVADHEVDTIAAALRVPPMDALIENLSIGERRRVALGHALLSPAEVLALDEPTNHLDAQTVAWLETRLAAWRGALLVVTHDRYFLDRVATRIIEIDRGRAHCVEGDYSEFLVVQAERHAREAEGEYQRQSFIRREIDWIRRAPQARGTKAKARIDRFDAANEAAPTTDDKRPGGMELRLPSGPRLGNTIVELAKASRSIGGKVLFRDLTLTMKPGDRIGIVGENGVGKSTLIKTILGEAPPDSGKVVVGQNTKPAYLEQGRSDLVDEHTVLQEVAEGYDYVEVDSNKIHVRTFLRQLGFAEAAMDVKVGQLSGGERNRVQLAKLLRRGGNLLVLDEPTNDLDLVTLGALEYALSEFPGCALIVSHDRWFLDRVATGILAFEGEGRVVFYEGDYSAYEAKAKVAKARAAAEAAATAAAAAGNRKSTGTEPRSGSTTNAPPAKPIKLTFRENKELAEMEATIGAAEASVVELETLLNDGAVFKDRPAEVPALIAKLDAARHEVERLYARWAELDAKRAAAGPA